jgi:hypothetical protein
MTAFLKLLPLLLPVVDHVVRTVETVIGHESGATKKAAAMDALQAAKPLLEATAKDVPWDETLQLAGGLVDLSVAVANKTGLFAKKVPAAS